VAKAGEQGAGWLGRRATALIDAASASLLIDSACSSSKFRETTCGAAVLTGFAAMMLVMAVISHPGCRQVPMFVSRLSEIPAAGPRTGPS
jgi:hypothetical protein